MAGRFFRRLRTLGPAVGLYLVGVALVGFAVDGGIYAVLLNLFLLRLGYGPELIGLVNSAGMLTFAIASLPAGALGGRFGSRAMMLIGLALLLVGGVLLPLADALPPAMQLPWLIGTNITLYLGLALFFVNTAPFVMETVAAERRAEVFSFQTALLSLAAFAGSLVGGALPPAFGALIGASLESPAPYRYALIVAGLAFIPSFAAIQAARAGRAVSAAHAPEDTPAPPAGADARRGTGTLLGVLALIAFVRLLQVGGIGATTTFFNVYLDDALMLPTAQIGAIIAVGRLLAVPAALTTSMLTGRFGNRAVVIGASLGSALSILPIALIPHWGAAAATFVGVVSLSWIRYAASLVFFLDLVPPSKRALVSGVTEMAAGLCFTALTFGGGYMIAILGYRPLFLTGAALTALGTLAFWLAYRNVPEPRPAPAPAA